ncbi:MAG: RdgB/HAM1 family non-canonical purine NTP pyrophosphatase [Cyclobacteriaceae bacterium]|nr:RdgB/HAM1 family non-canonical purine NTP pyrophosphatase [Cyclobacteriaceae bacterium]
MTLCFATNNRHKVEEVQAALGDAIRLITLAEAGITEELPENQDTLEGNAREKALYVFERYGQACFADDTGLEVDALGGAPGVYSARYAGPARRAEDNMALLLKNLEGKFRDAQFRTVIWLVTPNGEWGFEGVVRGRILAEQRGQGGFGYDPIFLPEGADKTLAEMSMDEKNRISHRGKAIRKLVDFLRSQ